MNKLLVKNRISHHPFNQNSLSLEQGDVLLALQPFLYDVLEPGGYPPVVERDAVLGNVATRQC